MTIKQKRAIYYSDRKRKLEKLEKLGFMDQYKKFRGNGRYHKIEWFCKKYGIRL